MPSNHLILCCPLLPVYLEIEKAIKKLEKSLGKMQGSLKTGDAVLGSAAQSCPALCDPMDCSPPDSSVCADSPGRNAGVGCHVLPSRGSFLLKNQTRVSCIACRFCTSWVTKEAPKMGISSIQFSHSVMSDSSWPHELQHARPTCPSPTPGAYSNSCLLSWWCHLTISSSVFPFSSHPQSFPASGSFQMSQFFTSGGQSIGSFSISISPSNERPRTDLLYDGLVGSPCSPRDSQESSPTPQFKSINSSALSFLHIPTLTSIHDHWKNRSFD